MYGNSIRTVSIVFLCLLSAQKLADCTKKSEPHKRAQAIMQN